MARSENNLTAVFTDTANAIREKTGDSALIIPRDFADVIASIEVGENKPIVTIDGVDYYHCVTSNEVGQNSMYLVDKTIIDPTTFSKPPQVRYFPANDNWILVYDGIHDSGLFPQTYDGVLQNQYTTYITNVYLKKNGSSWVLFYNLA